MRIKRTLSLALPVLALALALPAAAAAQACFGLPQGTRSAALGTIGFPSSATSFGVTGTTTLGENLYGSASYSLTSYDVKGIPNENSFGVRLAYEVPSLIESASVCPSVAASYSKLDDFSGVAIPFGVGIGTTMPLGETGTTTLTPFITPQFVWTRVSYDGASASDTYFGANAGATVGFGTYFAGASVTKIFEEGSDAVIGIHIGLSF
jgi:hypothetical protein